LQGTRQVRTHLPKVNRNRPARIASALPDLALAPASCLLARAIGVPGAAMHQEALVLGTRLLLEAIRARNGDLLWDAARLMRFPLDSFRYYELHLLCGWMREGPIPRRYLDISSPRLLPIALLNQGWADESVLMNPDRRDLGSTERMIDALRLGAHVDSRACTVKELPPDERAFDVISWVSVIEHIEDDVDAVRKIGELLSPGGRAYISLPCAPVGFVELIDYDEYGLGTADEDGYVFGQRFYDPEMLEERLFRILGRPSRVRFAGETARGTFFRNRDAAARGAYAFWKEPLRVNRDIRYFNSAAEMPGVGVAIMEFRKGSGAADGAATGGGHAHQGG